LQARKLLKRARSRTALLILARTHNYTKNMYFGILGS
jgi:hypothetical protein